jgi:tetratricopeptide (TPR) repeat protein
MKKLFLTTLIINLFIVVNAQDNYATGIAHYNSKNYPAAIIDLTKVIEIDKKGNVVTALYYRAQCKNKLEDYRGALIDFNMVLLISAEHKSEELAAVYLDRGRVNAILENYNESEQDFTEAIELKNSYAEAFINRGVIRINFLEKKEKGCIDFSRAGELGITKAYELIKEYCQ